MAEIPEVERRMREFTCGSCGAVPGEPCEAMYGKKRNLSAAHVSRFNAATDAGRLQIKDGGNDG